MKDPNLLLSILSVVWVVTIALFTYIIKLKDKSEDSTKKALEEIKNLVSNINLTVATLKSELNSNIYYTRELDKKVGSHEAAIGKLKLDVTKLVSHKVESIKKITDLEKEINYLKKKIK